jgi:hypothetical protein
LPYAIRSSQYEFLKMTLELLVLPEEDPGDGQS